MQSFDQLRNIMARLRGPDGCPWDREQSVDSLKDYLLEECYELLEALDGPEPAAVRGELGDLLFQIVFLSRLFEEQGEFDLEDVASSISEKMIRRHPHVFGESRLETADQVVRQWSEIKSEERGESDSPGSVLDGVPRHLPALQKCRLLSARASHEGFDWPEAAAVLDKVREELQELEQALSSQPERAGEEMGDLLFAVCNLARKLDLNAETCLQRSNDKFTRRFRAMEEQLRRQGLKLADLKPEALEEHWVQVKRLESEPGRDSG